MRQYIPNEISMYLLGNCAGSVPKGTHYMYNDVLQFPACAVFENVQKATLIIYRWVKLAVRARGSEDG
jgi:hypothetical protein